ncbi:hypothetical protein FQ707_04555 [Bacteroidaceae bacterium HV4-6-C5C]|nr:hypothetical protein FQ707_04555 [Bacteroidaceae bacterium HV4-6-C5C]
MYLSVFTYPLIRVKRLGLFHSLQPYTMRSTFRHLFRSSSPAFFMLLCTLPALWGCSHDKDEDVVEYSLNVSAVDPQGNDVTASGVISTIDLFLFDENGFVRVLPRGSSTGFLFNVSKSSKYTLVAWANLKGDSLKLPQLIVGTSLESARIDLLQSSSGHDIPVTDLFYSRLDILSASTKSVKSNTLRLVMERIVAGISVDVIHAAKHFGITDGNLRVVVRGTSRSLNFLGEPSADEASFTPTMNRVGDEDEWFAPLFRVFPAGADKQVYIDLYHGDTLLLTVTRDDEGNPLRAVSGKETHITVDFGDAWLHVSMSIVPWYTGSGQDVDL